MLVYIHVYMLMNRSIYIYIYMYTHLNIYLYKCIYIYIYIGYLSVDAARQNFRFWFNYIYIYDVLYDTWDKSEFLSDDIVFNSKTTHSIRQFWEQSSVYCCVPVGPGRVGGGGDCRWCCMADKQLNNWTRQII